eukprot:7138508-Prymnesium_polylepis.1
MLSPEAVSGHYARPAVPLARGCVVYVCYNKRAVHGRWPMMSPGAVHVSGRYARPAVPLARDTCR